MSEAIERTKRLYPGLLEQNQNLLFMLKCRQFVEMINGSDIEVSSRLKLDLYSSPRPESPIQTSVIQSTKSFSHIPKNSVSISTEELNQNNAAINGKNIDYLINYMILKSNKYFLGSNNCGDIPVIQDSDVEMANTDEVQNGHGDICNGKSNNSSNGFQNGNTHKNNPCLGDYWVENEDEDMGMVY